MSTETEPHTEWPAGLRWSEQLYSEHHGEPLSRTAPRLLGERFSYTPERCLTGFSVRLLPVGDGVFVCPFCGLLSRWATE